MNNDSIFRYNGIYYRLNTDILKCNSAGYFRFKDIKFFGKSVSIVEKLNGNFSIFFIGKMSIKDPTYRIFKLENSNLLNGFSKECFDNINVVDLDHLPFFHVPASDKKLGRVMNNFIADCNILYNQRLTDLDDPLNPNNRSTSLLKIINVENGSIALYKIKINDEYYYSLIKYSTSKGYYIHNVLFENFLKSNNGIYGGKFYSKIIIKRFDKDLFLIITKEVTDFTGKESFVLRLIDYNGNITDELKLKYDISDIIDCSGISIIVYNGHPIYTFGVILTVNINDTKKQLPILIYNDRLRAPISEDYLINNDFHKIVSKIFPVNQICNKDIIVVSYPYGVFREQEDITCCNTPITKKKNHRYTINRLKETSNVYILDYDKKNKKSVIYIISKGRKRLVEGIGFKKMYESSEFKGSGKRCKTIIMVKNIDDSYTYVNLSNFSPLFDGESFKFIEPFKDNITKAVCFDGTHCELNADGTISYREEILSMVESGKPDCYIVSLSNGSYTFGLKDKNGNIVLVDERYKSIDKFHEGYAAVSFYSTSTDDNVSDKYYGAIGEDTSLNRISNRATNFYTSHCGYISINTLKPSININRSIDRYFKYTFKYKAVCSYFQAIPVECYRFSDGLARVKVVNVGLLGSKIIENYGRLYIYIDTKGDVKFSGFSIKDNVFNLTSNDYENNYSKFPLLSNTAIIDAKDYKNGFAKIIIQAILATNDIGLIYRSSYPPISFERNKIGINTGIDTVNNWLTSSKDGWTLIISALMDKDGDLLCDELGYVKTNILSILDSTKDSLYKYKTCSLTHKLEEISVSEGVLKTNSLNHERVLDCLVFSFNNKIYYVACKRQ